MNASSGVFVLPRDACRLLRSVCPDGAEESEHLIYKRQPIQIRRPADHCWRGKGAQTRGDTDSQPSSNTILAIPPIADRSSCPLARFRRIDSSRTAARSRAGTLDPQPSPSTLWRFFGSSPVSRCGVTTGAEFRLRLRCVSCIVPGCRALDRGGFEPDSGAGHQHLRREGTDAAERAEHRKTE
jgi:hypothetical protein